MPTLRQKIAASKMVENGGNISKAMMAAGYSKATAKTPQKLTRSKGWQALMDKYYSDTKLAKKHAQLLEAKTINHYTFPISMTDKEIRDTVEKGVPKSIVVNIHSNTQGVQAHFSVPDNTTQGKMLELAYKVKGKMKVEKNGESDRASEEVREVIFRIRQMFPAAGQ